MLPLRVPRPLFSITVRRQVFTVCRQRFIGPTLAVSFDMPSCVPRDMRKLQWLLRGMPIGMLTTQALDGETRSRPMLVHDVDEDGWMWFLTDRHSRKACDLIHNPRATVVLQSARGDRYVSVQGI